MPSQKYTFGFRYQWINVCLPYIHTLRKIETIVNHHDPQNWWIYYNTGSLIRLQKIMPTIKWIGTSPFFYIPFKYTFLSKIKMVLNLPLIANSPLHISDKLQHSYKVKKFKLVGSNCCAAFKCIYLSMEMISEKAIKCHLTVKYWVQKYLESFTFYFSITTNEEQLNYYWMKFNESVLVVMGWW